MSDLDINVFRAVVSQSLDRAKKVAADEHIDTGSRLRASGMVEAYQSMLSQIGFLEALDVARAQPQGGPIRARLLGVHAVKQEIGGAA